jgi:hypothetical protein
MTIDAFERHAVHGVLAYEGMESTEVSILMPLELFEETSNADKAVNEKPLHVMVHGPLNKGCKYRFNLNRKDAVSAKNNELNETGSRPGPNNAQTIVSDDWTKPLGNVIITNPGGFTVVVVVKLKVTGVDAILPEIPIMEKSLTQQVQGTVILNPIVSIDVSTEMTGSILVDLHLMLKSKQSTRNRPAGNATTLSFEIIYCNEE